MANFSLFKYSPILLACAANAAHAAAGGAPVGARNGWSVVRYPRNEKNSPNTQSFALLISSYANDCNTLAPLPIKGKVVGPDNQGIPGATVVVKGTTQGTTSDADGNFSLNLPDGNATLVISSIGFVNQEIAVNGRTTVAITLQNDVQALSEAVVVGYGTQRREDVTGAVSSIKAEDIRTQGSNTVQKSLQGRIAGVQIESSGGNPGSGVRVVVRGAGSLNNNNPLYIVDGV
jgi:hypothetical protein